MGYFAYIKGELCCESLPVNEIARDVGTPFYLYTRNGLLDNFAALSARLGNLDALVCYALKANSNETLISLLAQRGAGADVVSGGELYLALKSGFPPERIVYAGVGKTDEEIRYALEEKIWSFNVECLEELHAINEIAGQSGATARIGIRINPDVDIKGHPYIATGNAENKFGIEVAKAREAIASINTFAHVKLAGFHTHIGSQIRDARPYLTSIELLKELKHDVASLVTELEYVDIGGGFGIDYDNALATDETPAGTLLADIVPSLEDFGCKIIVEPGRSLIATAGILVTKVLYRKETRGKRFLVVDAGMNDLLRPSLYEAHHEIIPVHEKNTQTMTADVVGPICESGDFLGKDRQLPEMARGELLAVLTAGAYGFSLSSNYNARPRPAEVLVDSGAYEIIRPRGTFENLWK
ncbi:MAG: diaminopimelate decarboxylase [bacterium]